MSSKIRLSFWPCQRSLEGRLPGAKLGITLARRMRQIIRVEGKHESADQHRSGSLDSGGIFLDTRGVFATDAASGTPSEYARRRPRTNAMPRPHSLREHTQAC